MKERPILFSAPMVRALMDGKKTQTRRIAKFPLRDINFGCELAGCEIGEQEAHDLCPYGQPGNQLWVRETFATLSASDYMPAKPAEGYGQDIRYAATDPLRDSNADIRGYSWRPSIHMPRWASRITLEITGIRVERLQAISAQDAQAEGIELVDSPHEGVPLWRDYAPGHYGTVSPVSSYVSLWESINGAGSWDLNPWVWVIEFRGTAQ